MNRARRVLAIAAGAVVAILAGSWLWLKSVESSRWARLQQRVAELRLEAELRCGPRPVLRGEPLPGDAWDDYLPAIQKVAGIESTVPVRRFIQGGTPADRAAGEALVAKYGDAVDLMQKGTRRASARRMRLHEHELPSTISRDTPLSHASVVGLLAVGRARLLSEQGRHREAADLLLDVGQFGNDVGRDGSAFALLYGNLILRPALNEIQGRLAAGAWPAEELRRIASELGEIDAGLPKTETALLGELEWLGELILSDRLIPHWFRGKPFPPEGRPGWRQAYSMRLLMTSGFDVVDGAVGRIRHADTGTWTDEMNRWKDFHAECEASRNIVAALYGAETSNRGRRELQSQMRLLRMAVHHAATGKWLGLDDPFGAKLLHREDPGELVLWSVGRDGVDDQGTGSWDRPADKDVVLKVRRAGK